MKRVVKTLVPCFMGTVFLFQLSSCSSCGTEEAERILLRQEVCFTEPPSVIPSSCSVDAPLLGNGYTGVALSGPPEQLVFRFARNDFWRLKAGHWESYPLVLGKMTLSFPQLEDAAYRVDQHLWDATTVARLEKGDLSVSCAAFVAATEDLMVVEVRNEGRGKVSGKALLSLPGAEEVIENLPLERAYPDRREDGISPDGVQYIRRAFVDSVDIPTAAAAALRVEDSGDGSFTLSPGERKRLVCAFSSDFKSEDCLRTALGRVAGRGCLRTGRLRRAHARWWKAYWNRSYVSIPDTLIERQYYRSLYGMASCSRDTLFPPPLFGTWITREHPAWSGDYHLNYNYQAPFYALYSANRLEQAEPYDAPLLSAIPFGQRYSERVTGIPDGLLLPVGIGPLGIETTCQNDLTERYRPEWIASGNIESGGMFWGQKSNAAYAVVNMAMRFYRTWDKAYARKVYPFVRGVATFWEHYLTREGDRYVILNDAIHEGTVGTMNPVLSLGLVRLVMDLACDMSEYLEVDAPRRETWRERRDHLSAYPLQEREGKTVFRYTERGVSWWGSNSLGIQHIYPGGQVGLASDSLLLEVARNTVDVMRRWMDFNGTNSFYPAAVRVGYPADSILLHLREYARHTYPNGFQYGNPHGVENLSTVPGTINEMLCMGHQDIVRVFPVWPCTWDARFHQIRVEGAFLVSASLQDGEVGPVTLRSEQGRDLTLRNPWGDRPVEVKSSVGDRQVLQGALLRMKTVPGGEYRFAPAGR